MNPLDERMHPVGDHAGWSESYNFNFVDPDTKIAMFSRMSFRPRDAWAEALHIVYLGGGHDSNRVAFYYGRRDIQHDLAHYDHDLRAGDMELVCVVPFQNWEVRFDGPCQDIADASVLLKRRNDRPEGWHRPARLRMQVDFNATSQPHYAAPGKRGHFEQTGAVKGRITLLGDGHTEAFPVSGFGVREKSWGSRDGNGDGANASGTGAQAPASTDSNPAPFANRICANFGADLALGGWCLHEADGALRGTGWIHRDGRTEGLTDVVIDSEYHNDSLRHSDIRLTARAADGDPIEMNGKVLTVCPTKIPMVGGATFVNEGLAEFAMGSRTGYGFSEHWHRVMVPRRKQPA